MSQGRTLDPPDSDVPWEWIYAPSSSSSKDHNEPGTLPTPPESTRLSPTQNLTSSSSNITTTRPTSHDRQAKQRPPPPHPPITGARKGDFTVQIGDIVALKAERNDTWVAIITSFLSDFSDDVSSSSSSDSPSHEQDADAGAGAGGGTKAAEFTWFSSLREIRDRTKRLPSVYANELYITPSSDVNPLETISGRAIVLGPAEFTRRYPGGKVPRGSEEVGRVFVCRRGCNTRNVTYTEEFVWEDVYRGREDLGGLRGMVEEGTRTGKKAGEVVRGLKRKAQGGGDGDGDGEFVVKAAEGEGEEGPKTPRKRRRVGDVETPKSKRGGGAYTTPTHKRIITKRPLEFTPLGTRKLPFSTPNQTPTKHTSTQNSPFQTPHSIARSNLHVSAVPAALPCREAEFDSICSTLASHITSSSGTCVYISGTPGTGKTATVREVIAQLYAAVRAEELDDFIFVEINGLKVADPHQSYSLLWEALMGERVAPGQALGLLEREFKRPSPRRVPCVVLMDELDQLVTRNQEVMYNFFNWPTLPHSRLIVLAVANTMDLPERTLSNKISSRLGLTRITFQGYTHGQLMTIIQSRLESVQGRAGATVVVESDAIQFAARKVAQVSGDARRVLDMCRRAVEIAETELEEVEDASSGDPRTPSKRGRGKADGGGASVEKTKGRVTIATVQKAIREATSTPLQQYLRHLPLASKLFLAAFLALSRRTGVGEAILGDIVEEAKKLGNMSESSGMKEWLLHAPANQARKAVAEKQVPRVLGMGTAATMLLEAGVVVTEERKGERWARVRLQVGEEEVKAALREDTEVGALGFRS
ncbi:MAG: Origin recognition complex, subunit 1 [Chrysothrix sp. TS-e1954]|nr:MAG: Origin recognition complex, subunit 1 [Chrysothrix sp. TS-e1954]